MLGFSFGSPEADLKTGIQVQIVYWDGGKNNGREGRQRREGI